MSDPFDGDPDDVLEPDDSQSEEGEFNGAPSSPEPSVPEANAPEVPSPETGIDVDYDAVDPALRTLFWKLIFLIKITLLCLTLGVLFVVFEERVALGRRLLAFAVILALYAAYRYRTGKERIDDGEFELGEDDSDHQSAETEGAEP